MAIFMQASFRAWRPQSRVRPRRLAFEALDERRTLSATPWLAAADSVPLGGVNVTATTGEKPQSKVWEYDGQWFTVLPDASGTWVRRLDGNTWTSVLRLTPDTHVQADVKTDGNLATCCCSTAYIRNWQRSNMFRAHPTWQPWSVQPKLVDVVLSAGVETATIDIDGAGRLWLASDALTSIEVRHSEYPYAAFRHSLYSRHGSEPR